MTHPRSHIRKMSAAVSTIWCAMPADLLWRKAVSFPTTRRQMRSDGIMMTMRLKKESKSVNPVWIFWRKWSSISRTKDSVLYDTMVSITTRNQNSWNVFMNWWIWNDILHGWRNSVKSSVSRNSGSWNSEPLSAMTSTETFFAADAVRFLYTLTHTIHWKELKMTEHTDKTVLMKCIKCGYTEDVPLSDLLTLRELYDLKGPEDDSVLCPFCLHDMYPVSSDHFTKNSDK